MSKADIWMPLYIGDYLADTTRLTTEQHGAYLLLIMDYWRNGPPPDDDAILSNITKMQPKEWKRTKNAVMNFFCLAGGTWTQSRIDRELSDANKGKEKAILKAKNAAYARWGNESSSNAPSNAPSIVQALLEECPLPSPSEVKSKARPDKPDFSEGFAKFWQAWPTSDRKTAKAECFKRWKTKGFETHAAEILSHLQSVAGSKKWTDGYAPAPLTYINQQHWLDGANEGGAKPWEQ